MARSVVVMFLSLAFLGALVASLIRSPKPVSQAESSEPLVIYCAASNKSVLEAIRGDYERDYKTPLQIQYGPSQTLLASLEVSGSGDLYLPADDSYLALARERKLLAGDSSVF
ncbi:MAG: substrate-binding domain-containing protein, partial [Planctomycetaceae bacterium]|nr:substrate-binding domain-containing protein [Planctomycetaceae bacterium]